MRQSNRLIFNTLAVYCRMALTVGIGLLATRWALKALAEESFGLYYLLLGTVGALGIFSNAFMASVARHLAFEIGGGDEERIRRTYNTSMGLTILLALGGALIGVLSAKPILSMLKITPGHEMQAFWVYQWCVVFTIVAIIGNLFSTTLTSYQAIIMTTLVDIYQCVMQLIILLVLQKLSMDKAVGFAALMAGVQLSVTLISMILCWRFFPMTRPRLHLFDWPEAKRIGSFTGWSMLGQISDTLGSMGWQWVLNRGFGTSLNASMGIVQRLGGYQKSLAWAMTTPLRPAITAMEAREDRTSQHRLVLLAGKYPVLIMLFYLIPLELEVEKLLSLWLGDYPQYTPAMVRLALIGIALTGFGSGLESAISAKGKIAGYALLMAAPSALIIGLASILIFGFAMPPWTLPAVAVGFGIAMEISRAWYVGKVIGLPISRWFRESLLPVIGVAVLAGGAALLVRMIMPATLLRVMAVTATYGLVALPAIWWLAMGSWEREHFLRVAGEIALRVARKKAMQPVTVDATGANPPAEEHVKVPENKLN